MVAFLIGRRALLTALCTLCLVLGLAAPAAAAGPIASPTRSAHVPAQGETVGVIAAEGVVYVRPPGKRAVRLTGERIIPVGSTVNTTRGKVIVRSACPRCAPGARLQSGTFSGGLFKVTQPHKHALTTLTLNGSLRRCVGTSRGAGFRRIARYLVGHTNARFRVVARYASASTRRGSWLIVDYCRRTFVAARTGTLRVTDRLRGRSIRLKVGRVISIIPPSRGLPLGSGCCMTSQSEGVVASATLVTRPDGTTVPAGSLEAGDLVRSADGSSAQVLVANHVDPVDMTMMFIAFEDGQELLAGPSTQVFTETGPQQADLLVPPEMVETAGGTTRVARIAEGRFSGQVTALAVGGRTGAFIANGILTYGMTG